MIFDKHWVGQGPSFASHACAIHAFGVDVHVPPLPHSILTALTVASPFNLQASYYISPHSHSGIQTAQRQRMGAGAQSVRRRFSGDVWPPPPPFSLTPCRLPSFCSPPPIPDAGLLHGRGWKKWPTCAVPASSLATTTAIPNRVTSSAFYSAQALQFGQTPALRHWRHCSGAAGAVQLPTRLNLKDIRLMLCRRLYVPATQFGGGERLIWEARMAGVRSSVTRLTSRAAYNHPADSFRPCPNRA